MKPCPAATSVTTAIEENRATSESGTALHTPSARTSQKGCTDRPTVRIGNMRTCRIGRSITNSSFRRKGRWGHNINVDSHRRSRRGCAPIDVVFRISPGRPARGRINPEAQSSGSEPRQQKLGCISPRGARSCWTCCSIMRALLTGSTRRGRRSTISVRRFRVRQ
jgi:hypothetical protein